MSYLLDIHPFLGPISMIHMHIMSSVFLFHPLSSTLDIYYNFHKFLKLAMVNMKPLPQLTKCKFLKKLALEFHHMKLTLVASFPKFFLVIKEAIFSFSTICHYPCSRD